MLRLANALLVLVLLVVALITLRETPEPETPAHTIAGMREHQSDYYLENFTLKSYDVAGKLHRELQGVTLIHYPLRDYAEIESLKVDIHSDQGPPLHLESAQGRLSSDGQQLVLLGQVDATQPGHQDREPFYMRSSNLTIDQTHSTVVTDDFVNLRSSFWRASGTGLFADVNKREYTLLNNVEYHYVARD